MKIDKAMERFLQNEVASASARWQYQAMSVLQKENKRETIKRFVDELQEGISNEDTCYLQIALMRYRTLQKRPFYQLQAFGSGFYLMPPQMEKELTWEWLYGPYYTFCEEMTVASRRYVMQISQADLSQLFMLELEESKQVVRRVFQESLPEILRRGTVKEASSRRTISIQLSDYMGRYETLLVLDPQTRRIGDWLDGIFQDHTGDRI